MVTTLFVLFVVLLAMAVPIFVVLSFSTLAAFWMHSPIPLETIVQRLFAGLDKFALMAIPFYGVVK
ncbi:MAG: TRAP transporter large permease subunit [candidate division NC10 bacterium]|nr:TRAP transporter large permease subunit [candidate division NC10 bacterium]